MRPYPNHESKHDMHAHALLPLLFVAPLALPLQDEAPTTAQEAEPEAWEMVLNAFEGLHQQPFGFTGSVTREKPKQNENNVSTLASREVTDVAGAMETIEVLLDSRRLARASDQVEWTAEALPDGKGHVIRGVLPPTILDSPRPDPRANGMPMGIVMDFGPSNDDALRVETALTLDANGALIASSFAVVHNDANAAMQIAFEDAEDGDGVFDFEPEEGFQEVDGEVVTWSFRFTGEQAPANIEAFRAEALKLLETEDF